MPIVSLNRLSFVGCVQKVRCDPEPLALATETGPPSCSVMGVYVCFVLGSNSVKIKAIMPENSSLKEGDLYTDTNMEVCVCQALCQAPGVDYLIEFLEGPEKGSTMICNLHLELRKHKLSESK